MNKEIIILIAEDDEGHAELIRRNLIRAGLVNKTLHFSDGQLVLDFLFRRGTGPHRVTGESYVLLLDICMPKVNGTEVLKQLKADPELRVLPVIIVSTTDDPYEVQKCHTLGCSNYITKPIEYNSFVHAIRQLGFFLAIVEIPHLET
ncbi:MAG: response regulator [Planctomycetota bacterium]